MSGPGRRDQRAGQPEPVRRGQRSDPRPVRRRRRQRRRARPRGSGAQRHRGPQRQARQRGQRLAVRRRQPLLLPGEQPGGRLPGLGGLPVAAHHRHAPGLRYERPRLAERRRRRPDPARQEHHLRHQRQPSRPEHGRRSLRQRRHAPDPDAGDRDKRQRGRLQDPAGADHAGHHRDRARGERHNLRHGGAQAEGRRQREDRPGVHLRQHGPDAHGQGLRERLSGHGRGIVHLHRCDQRPAQRGEPPRHRPGRRQARPDRLGRDEDDLYDDRQRRQRQVHRQDGGRGGAAALRRLGARGGRRGQAAGLRAAQRHPRRDGRRQGRVRGAHDLLAHSRRRLAAGAEGAPGLAGAGAHRRLRPDRFHAVGGGRGGQRHVPGGAGRLVHEPPHDRRGADRPHLRRAVVSDRPVGARGPRRGRGRDLGGSRGRQRPPGRRPAVATGPRADGGLRARPRLRRRRSDQQPRLRPRRRPAALPRRRQARHRDRAAQRRQPDHRGPLRRRRQRARRRRTPLGHPQGRPERGDLLLRSRGLHCPGDDAGNPTHPAREL